MQSNNKIKIIFRNNLAPLTISAAEESCRAACVFDPLFHRLSSCQGRVSCSAHQQSRGVRSGVTRLLWFCSQSFPQQRGQPWFLPGLYPTQWGAPDSSAHQPDLYACKMYISAVSKQGHSHFWEDVWDLSIFWLSPVSDFLLLFSNCAGETDNRVLIVSMNECMRIVLGKPNRNQMCFPAFNMWWSVDSDFHISEYVALRFPSFASLWCSVTINIPTLSRGLLKAQGLIRGSSKTCKLSVSHCDSCPTPPLRFFIPAPPPFSQTSFCRMAQLFFYSPVAL